MNAMFIHGSQHELVDPTLRRMVKNSYLVGAIPEMGTDLLDESEPEKPNEF